MLDDWVAASEELNDRREVLFARLASFRQLAEVGKMVNFWRESQLAVDLTLSASPFRLPSRTLPIIIFIMVWPNSQPKGPNFTR